MKTADFEYSLPPELIAQQPPSARGLSRMMVVHVASGRIEHAMVADIGRWVRAGDLMVANNTRVIPARLSGKRTDTGGRVELLLLEERNDGTWDAMYHASTPARNGIMVRFGGGGWVGEVLEKSNTGRVRIRFNGGAVGELLSLHGVMPVPPYIKRQQDSPLVGMDKERYQTVYARMDGAIAAPTAGLHFSNELLESLKRSGIGWCEVTLHVGPGTFRPVKTDNIEDHVMEPEKYEIREETADLIRRTKQSGNRVVGIGSTTVRTLEAVAAQRDELVAASGRSSLFICPGFRFRVVDAILTNFHLPRSTLLMMVSAFAGRDLVLRAYSEAISLKYRFYSYGDCMLLI